MRHVKDHKDKMCSHGSAPLGPAAPVTWASSPFSCSGAARTNEGCEIGPFPTVAVEARLGFASLLLCFIAVNPELTPLRNTCSPLFLCLQKHLQNARSLAGGFFSSPPDFMNVHFSALSLRGKVYLPLRGALKTAAFLQGHFCLLSKVTPTIRQETGCLTCCTFVYFLQHQKQSYL